MKHAYGGNRKVVWLTFVFFNKTVRNYIVNKINELKKAALL